MDQRRFDSPLTGGGNKSYLLPAGAVMRLFGRHHGTQGVAVRSAPDALDVAASRGGNRIYLHVATLTYQGAVEASFGVQSMAISEGRVLLIAPEDPRQEVSPLNPEIFAPQEYALGAQESVRFSFPARSVGVVELTCQ